MRGSGLTDSDNFGIEDATDDEVEWFLRPLNRLELRHIGWKGFDPVFSVNRNSNSEKVANQILSTLDNDKIRSAGHTAYILESDTEFQKSVISDSIIVLKVEDWRKSCIPNDVHGDQQRIENYISSRESDISNRMSSKLPDRMRNIVDRHVENGGLHGQFQFLSVADSIDI